MAKYADQTRRIVESIFAPTDKPQMTSDEKFRQLDPQDDKLGGRHPLPTRTRGPVVAVRARGRNNVSICSDPWIWRSSLRNVALAQKSQGKTRIRYIAQISTYSATTYAWGFRTCRRRHVATALPHEVLPTRGSWTGVWSQRQLLAITEIQRGHFTRNNYKHCGTSFLVATLQLPFCLST